MKTLDEHDVKVIRIFKDDAGDKLNRVKAVWAERCAMPLEYIHLQYINNHFLFLAKQLGLLDNEYVFVAFIRHLTPADNWRYIGRDREYLTKETADFDLILFSRLDSLFALTKVSDLPGYDNITLKPA